MLLFWGAILAAIVLAWALERLWRIVAIGAAYRSKVLASIVFGTARPIDPRRAEEVSLDSYRILRLFRSKIDRDARTVTTSLLGLRRRTAIFRPGLGATLSPGSAAHLHVRPLDGRTDPGVGLVAPAASHQPQPSTIAARPASDAVGRVIADAFAEPNPRRLRRTRAIVVLHDGEIVGERYAPGFDVSTPLAGWSMTKSVLNALFGILVGDKRISLGARALMPGWQPPDPRAAITIEDLLRMRSGLRFSEVYADFSSDVIEMLFNQADSAAYAASQPLAFAPGSTWSYASGTTNILSAIARRVVGDAAYPTWPRRALFEPLGMTSAVVEPDAAGTFVCSSFMMATARDWLRFGQLFLQDGVWEGQRLLPEGWVRFSATPTPQSPGGNYGAHWWLKLQPDVGGGGAAAARIPPDAFFAIGHEAQTLTVIPSRRLVVVRLGLSIYIDAWNHATFIADLLDALP